MFARATPKVSKRHRLWHSAFQRSLSAPTKELPRSADVVVVGGGVIGCSTLYHLSKLGVSAVLVDKDPVGSGTSWHSAGLLWRLRPSDVDIELCGYTRDLAKSILEEETGLSCGWKENGALWPAMTDERLDEFRRMSSLGKFYGIESHILTPGEVQDLYPEMKVSDIKGGVYSPGDGSIEPSNIMSAYLKGAKAGGAKVVENCSVTGIDTVLDPITKRRFVTGVQTSEGNIETSRVVNCTGVWGRKFGELAGVNVPLIPMKHAYVVTEEIPELGEMPNMRDHDASVYFKVQSQNGSMALGGYELNPEFCESISETKHDEFAFSLFDLNWDIFQRHIEKCINRVPILETTGIVSEVSGPESFTPDHKAVIGEAPELDGFFVGCGFNSAGIMLSGGCGRELAHWTVHGHANLDMFEYDIRRFSSDLTNNDKWIKERSHESHANTYEIVFPNDQPLASRKMKMDDLHSTVADAGAVFEQVNGWERPAYFCAEHGENGQQSIFAPSGNYNWYGQYGHGDAEEHKDDLNCKRKIEEDLTFEFPPCHKTVGNEVRFANESCGVFVHSGAGKLLIRGPESSQAMDWICTNKINPGEAFTSLMCNKEGQIVGYIDAASKIPSENPHETTYALKIRGEYIEHHLHHISKVIAEKGFNCAVENVTDKYTILSLYGPTSQNILQSAALDNNTFDFISINHTEFGTEGTDLWISGSDALQVYNEILHVGQELHPIGHRAYNSLAAEHSVPHFTKDIRACDSPAEADLLFLCKFDQTTPFLGCETIERQKLEGVHKKLVCLTVSEGVPLNGTETIWRNNECVGYLNRAEFSHLHNYSIGFGYVHSKQKMDINTSFLSDAFEIDVHGRKRPAVLREVLYSQSLRSSDDLLKKAKM